MSQIDKEKCVEIERLREGGEDALAEYFVQVRPELRRIASRQIQRQLECRLDASDILQDAYLRARQQLGRYVSNPQMPVFSWLKRICLQSLMRAYQCNIGTAKRSIEREQASIAQIETEDANCQPISRGERSSPLTTAIQKELVEQVVRSINDLKDVDRDIIHLVHDRNLTLREAAGELNIAYEAAKKRYRRALRRLGDALAQSGLKSPSSVC